MEKLITNYQKNNYCNYINIYLESNFDSIIKHNYINSFIKIYFLHLKINDYKMLTNATEENYKKLVLLFIFIVTNDIKYYNTLINFISNTNDKNNYFYKFILKNFKTEDYNTLKERLIEFKKGDIIDLIIQLTEIDDTFFDNLYNLTQENKTLIKSSGIEDNDLKQLNEELNKIKDNNSSIFNNKIEEYNNISELNQINKKSNFYDELIIIEAEIEKNKITLIDRTSKDKKQQKENKVTNLNQLKDICNELIKINKEFNLDLIININTLQKKLNKEKDIKTFDNNYSLYKDNNNKIKTEYKKKYNEINKEFKFEEINDTSKFDEIINKINLQIKEQTQKRNINTLNKLLYICKLLKHITEYNNDDDYYNSQITIAYYKDLIDNYKTPIYYYDELDTDTIIDNLLVYIMHLDIIRNKEEAKEDKAKKEEAKKEEAKEFDIDKIFKFFDIYQNYQYDKTSLSINNLIKAHNLVVNLLSSDEKTINQFFETVYGS